MLEDAAQQHHSQPDTAHSGAEDYPEHENAGSAGEAPGVSLLLR
jgi:hypothetical protein